jgi:hypothetical protein
MFWTIQATTVMDINSHRYRDGLEGINNHKEDNLTDSHIRYQVITELWISHNKRPCYELWLVRLTPTSTLNVFLCNIVYTPNCTASGPTTAEYTISFYCRSKLKDRQDNTCDEAEDNTCQHKGKNCYCVTNVCLCAYCLCSSRDCLLVMRSALYPPLRDCSPVMRSTLYPPSRDCSPVMRSALYPLAI